MRKYTQNIHECCCCGKVFDDGEDFWKDCRGKCYCVDNKCGWEDAEENDNIEQEN